MTETIRLIIAELAKEPFKKSFTVISFDSLQPEQLLQVLSDVLAEFESSNKVDIREEAPEDTVVRILNTLKILKYRPQEDIDPSALRSGLISGSPKVIHPILAWILPKMTELKTRAYLAKYLMKVEIPQEIRADIDIEELYQQYEAGMEQFKVVHKQLETMKSKGFTTSEIRKDIAAMEQEQESVTRKIEKLKRQVEGTSNIEATLEVVRTFRKEKEKARELEQQQVSQTQALNQAEQRIQRLQRQLKEIKAAAAGATAEGHLQRLEQDIDVARYIVSEKLPKECESRRKEIHIMEKVLSEGAITPKDLEDTRYRIDRVKSEVNDMVMKRMAKSEDDKLVMFRQQAAIVANKKSTLVEKLNDLKAESVSLKDEVTDKKKILGNLQGDTIVKEEDFKEYVKNLRVKSTRYKQMKGEMNYLRAESGVLSKTLFILEEQLQSSSIDLNALEAKFGIKGFSEMQGNLEKISTEKSVLDEKKSEHLQKMSDTVQELHEKIAAKKVDLAPLVKTLNNVRQDAQVLGHEHETAKRKYDSVVSSVESSMSSLIKDVDNLRKTSEEDQLRYCRLQSEIVIYKVELKRMQEELKAYAAAGQAVQDRKKSYKEQLMTNISEQERLGKRLKEEEKEISERQSDRVNQVVMWKDLIKLLELKKQLKESTVIRN